MTGWGHPEAPFFVALSASEGPRSEVLRGLRPSGRQRGVALKPQGRRASPEILRALRPSGCPHNVARLFCRPERQRRASFFCRPEAARTKDLPRDPSSLTPLRVTHERTTCRNPSVLLTLLKNGKVSLQELSKSLSEY